MARRCLVTVLIAFALLPQMAHAGGPVAGSGTRPPFGVQTRGGGLVVTLFLIQPMEPQNALVRANVRLWNTTSSPIQVQDPTVDVLWPSGRPAFSAQQGRYPAGVVAVSPPSGVPIGPTEPLLTIGPRQAIARHIFVIMRTGRLQATTARIQSGSGTAYVLRTPVLLARLGRAPYPRVSIGQQSGSLVATITPESPLQAGTLWYMSAMQCGTSTRGTTTWSRVPYFDRQPNGSYRLTAPNCEGPVRWSIVAGWLGQPVGAGNYSS